MSLLFIQYQTTYPPNLNWFGDEIAIASIRTWLDAYWQWLDERVLNSDIWQIILARSQAVDWLLTHLAIGLGDRGRFALFAIGGYGRCELSPKSDIDLLLVYQVGGLGEFESFCARLWDLGLKPAICVQPLDEMGNPSETTLFSDTSHATALLDGRFLLGNEAWRPLPMIWLKTHWTYERFYVAKCQEKSDRQRSHQNSVHHLEPNLKTGVGGLRAIQLVGWLLKALIVFGIDEMPQMVSLPHTLNNPRLWQEEQVGLIQALAFFCQVRHHLHQLTGKSEEQLLFAHQRTLASKMGYPSKDDNPNHAPEQLMRAYFCHASFVHATCELVCALLSPQCLANSPIIGIPIDGTPFVQFEDYQTRRSQIALLPQSPQVFFENEHALLGLFVAMAEQGIDDIEPMTARQLRQAAAMIDATFCQKEVHQQQFVRILSCHQHLANVLHLMAIHGVLGRYLPKFGQIMGLMQYDLFHRYTVDEHTLRLIGIVGQFGGYQRYIPPNLLDKHTEQNRHFAELCQLYQTLDMPYLLGVAGLFHDIAKGQMGDHSVNGAKAVQAFCVSHGFDEQETKLLVWLVQEHLTMSLIAQKKDIHDPSVLLTFARLVGDKRRLLYLYLLTVADMNATNSQLWNDWRATLLHQLYQGVLPLLDRKHAPDTILLERKKAAQALSGLSMPVLSAFWADFEPEYFAKDNAETLAWHATQILTTNQSDKTLLAIRPHPDTGLNAYELMVYTPSQDGLFLAIVAWLDSHHYSVLKASITTNKQGMALDTFVVLSRLAPTLDDHQVLPLPALMDGLYRALSCPFTLPSQYRPQNHTFLSSKQGVGRWSAHFRVHPNVVLSCIDEVGSIYELSVIAKDRPQLLFDIANTLFECGVWVHHATIMTLGVRAEDVFVIGVGANPDSHWQATLQKKVLMVVSP